MRAGYFRRIETADQMQWTHDREHLAMLYNIHRPEGAKAVSGAEYMPLKIDPKPKRGGKAAPKAKGGFSTWSMAEREAHFARINEAVRLAEEAQKSKT